MVARPPPRAALPVGEELRRRLVRDLGWRPDPGEPSELEVGGRRFRVSPLASGRRCVALWCEPISGASLPDYPARRGVRTWVRRSFPRALVVHTDAAHTEQVWSWETREAGGPLACHELGRRPEQPWSEWLSRLRPIVSALEEPHGPDPGEGKGGEVTLEVLGALVARVRRGSPGTVPRGLAGTLPRSPSVLGQRVQDCIETAEDPAVLRAWWRGLTGLTALDPGCGTGGWLLGVTTALEPVYAACLDRMQGWVDELERRPPAPRQPRLGDFRAVLERAGDSRLRFARESILLRTLFGAERDSAARTEAESRLLARLGANDPAPIAAHFPTRLREGDLSAGFATLRELRDALLEAGEQERGPALLEEAAALQRAERRVLELRLAERTPLPELRAAHDAILRRRGEAARVADRLSARREGVDPRDDEAVEAWRSERRPLHACLEHPRELRRDGFSLLRGSGA